MLWIPVGIGLALGGGGCSCRPTLPLDDGDDDGDDDDTTEDTFTTEETADTAPEPPCFTPEVESNNAAGDGTPLVLEQRGCGTVNPAFDPDYWVVDVEDDGWLTIEVAATPGSIADPTFLLEPLDAPWSASAPDRPETLDASLTFLAPAGAYSLLVTEQSLSGGDRFGYDVLVTEAKPPVDGWSRTEVEANDDSATAEVVTSGDIVYGTMDGNGALADSDWYTIVVPAGRHTVDIEIVGYAVGSGADLSAYLYDATLEPLPENCAPCEFRGGATPNDLDPVVEYESLGAELVYVQVTSTPSCRGSGEPCPDGPANWYTMAISLVEEK